MDAIKEERFTPEQVVAAIELTQGNVSLAARNLNTSRSTLYNYLIKYPELKQALADTRESMMDHAESALRNAAIKGEGWAVCFMLKCLGKSRGYVERQELTGKDGGPIQVSDEDAMLELAYSALKKKAEAGADLQEVIAQLVDYGWMRLEHLKAAHEKLMAEGVGREDLASVVHTNG